MGGVFLFYRAKQTVFLLFLGAMGAFLWQHLCADCQSAIRCGLENAWGSLSARLADLPGAKAYLQERICKLSSFMPWEDLTALVENFLTAP